MVNSRGTWLIAMTVLFAVMGFGLASLVNKWLPGAAFNTSLQTEKKLNDDIPVDLRPSLDGETASYLGRYPGKETEEIKRLADEINHQVVKIPKRSR